VFIHYFFFLHEAIASVASMDATPLYGISCNFDCPKPVLMQMLQICRDDFVLPQI